MQGDGGRKDAILEGIHSCMYSADLGDKAKELKIRARTRGKAFNNRPCRSL